MLEIKDVLNLLGKELKDGSEQAERFREFVEQEKWTTEQIRKWNTEGRWYPPGRYKSKRRRKLIRTS